MSPIHNNNSGSDSKDLFACLFPPLVLLLLGKCCIHWYCSGFFLHHGTGSFWHVRLAICSRSAAHRAATRLCCLEASARFGHQTVRTFTIKFIDFNSLCLVFRPPTIRPLHIFVVQTRMLCRKGRASLACA
jgi:hypothetical protein